MACTSHRKRAERKSVPWPTNLWGNERQALRKVSRPTLSRSHISDAVSISIISSLRRGAFLLHKIHLSAVRGQQIVKSIFRIPHGFGCTSQYRKDALVVVRDQAFKCRLRLAHGLRGVHEPLQGTRSPCRLELPDDEGCALGADGINQIRTCAAKLKKFRRSAALIYIVEFMFKLQ